MEQNNKPNEKQTDNFLFAWFNKQADAFEASRFAWMTMYITIQSCLGAIACAFILQNHASVFMLASCAAISMASNAVFIAQGDKKWCMAVFYLSLLANTVFILVNL